MHWIGNFYLSDIFLCIIPWQKNEIINHEIITENWNIITLKYSFILVTTWLKHILTSTIACSLSASFFNQFVHCDGAIFAHSSSQNCSGWVRSVRERWRTKMLWSCNRFSKGIRLRVWLWTFFFSLLITPVKLLSTNI